MRERENRKSNSGKKWRNSKNSLVLFTCSAISGNKASSAERVVGPAAYEGTEAAVPASWTKQRAALLAPPRRRFETTTTAAAASAPLCAPPCCCWRLFLSPWLVSLLTSRARLLLMLGQVGETASSQADMKLNVEGMERQIQSSKREKREEKDCSLSLSPPWL